MRLINHNLLRDFLIEKHRFCKNADGRIGRESLFGEHLNSEKEKMPG